MSNMICKCCGSDRIVDDGYYCGTTYARCEQCGQNGEINTISEPETVFYRITASPEVLAPQFIFKQWHAFDGKWGWFSLLLMDGDTLDSPWFESYEEAYAATVAKLKEVAE